MAFTVSGRVLQRQGQAAVPGVQVAPLVKVAKDLASLTQVTTDPKGHFEIALDEKQWKQFLKTDDGAYIFFRVFRSGEKDPLFDTQGTLHWRPDVPVRGKEILILVDLPEMVNTQNPVSLDQLNTTLKLGISAEVLKQLSSLGVESLSDIVSKGGLANVKGISLGDNAALKALDAQANLSLVSTDLNLNSQLIAAGYSNVLDIALSPPSLFLKSIPKVDAMAATNIHNLARVAERVVTNASSDVRMRTLRGDLSVPGPSANLFPKTCGCENCQNASSPMAYLVDLLDYATRHVLINGQAATLTALETRFHQPFRGLPADCEAMDAVVRQARICIEVLRQILPAAQRNQTPQWYLQAAYFQLLQGAGTSFDELRTYRAKPPNFRVPLAQKLQIPFDPAAPGGTQNLDQLFRDPTTPAADMERFLYEMFGLRDTTANPLTPDPPRCKLELLRRSYWYTLWENQDWNTDVTQATLGRFPIIDPDVIGYSDLADLTPATTPRANRPKTQWSALDFYEDRLAWINVCFSELDNYRQAHGLTDLLNQLQNGNMVPNVAVAVMTGITVSTLLDYQHRLTFGQDISGWLTQVGLSMAEFMQLSQVAALDRANPPQPILASEWHDFYSIIIKRSKELAMYAAWRSEEANTTGIGGQRISLTSKHFQIVPQSMLDGGPGSQSVPFRSIQSMRDNWEETLQDRIDREQEITDQIQAGVDATEGALLTELRNDLLRTAATLGLLGPTSVPGGLLSTADLAWFTRNVEIDCQAGGCQKTTRISQAIQTIQGIIFDARKGLLPDASITLTDTDAFDQEWQWMGSYTSWKAAIIVFLYPENVLRPTFRKRQSPGLEDFIDAVRDAGSPVAQNIIGPLADYEDYFRDICTLSTDGLLETMGLVPLASGEKPPDLGSAPWSDVGDVIAIANGAQTGSHYFSTWKRLPGWGLRGSPEQSLWRKIADLDNEMSLVGLVAYTRAPDVTGVALYFRGKQNGIPYYQLGTYSASAPNTISIQPLDEFRALINTSGIFDQKIPPSPLQQLAGTQAWVLNAGDQFCTADIDGNGRDEVLVFAGQLEANGSRKVGVLREMGGGLVLDQVHTFSGGWNLPDPARPVVYATGTLKRVLVVNSVGNQLATIGWVNGSLEVIAPASQFNGPGGAWGPTGRPAFFVSARIDSSNVNKLVVFEYGPGDDPINAPTGTFVTVLTWGNDTFSVFAKPGELKHPVNANEFPGTETTTIIQSVKWERFLVMPRRFGPQGSIDHVEEDLLLFTSRTMLEAEQDNIPHGDRIQHQVEVPATWLYLFTWDGTQFKPQFAITPNYQDEIIAGSPTTTVWPLDASDQFILATPPPDWNRPDDTFYYDRQVIAYNQAQKIIAVLGVMKGVPSSKDPNDEEFKVTWQAKEQIPAASAATVSWLLSASDYILAFDINGDGHDEILIVNPPAAELGVLEIGTDLSLKVRAVLDSRVYLPGSVNGWFLGNTAQIISGDIDGDAYSELLATAVEDNELRLGILHAIPGPMPRRLSAVPAHFGPIDVPPVPIFESPTEWNNQTRRQLIQGAYQANLVPGLGENIIYLDEAFYFIQIEIALRLMQDGDYADALDWLRMVYDYEDGVANAKIAYKLILDAGQPDFTRQANWLRDPLDPHAIAESRKDSYTKFTILTIVQCLLAYGDSEFTQATSESISHARDLYLKALELLGLPELLQHLPDCLDLVGRLTLIIGSDEIVSPFISQLQQKLQGIGDYSQISDLIGQIEKDAKRFTTPLDKAASASAIIKTALAKPGPAKTVESVVSANLALRQTLASATAPVFMEKKSGISELSPSVIDNLGHLRVRTIPAPSFAFCIPENLLISALAQHAQNDLAKLRSCRNIAGLTLVVDPYPVATVADTVTDQLPSAKTASFQPLPYRYATLIDRAKQLIELARQMESSMIQFLTAAEQETYQDIKARQDLALSYASLRLKDLQVVQAQDGVVTAQLQTARAGLQQQHYQDLISAGLSTNETLGLGLLAFAAMNQHAAAGADWSALWSVEGFVGTAETVGTALSATAQALSMTSQSFFQVATFERRAQDWQLQADLATQDVAIGQQQERSAADQVQVVQQDRAVAQLQVQNAQSTLDFLLTGKLFGAALYEWMASVTESTYRFFLQQSTSMAKLAASQLGFERQEVIPEFIKDDYWQPPADGQTPDFSPPGTSGDPSNLHGLTGSARLLRDIYELDQYAFQTNQRKLQISVSISLTQLDSIAFQKFRSTGVFPFNITNELLDREFPGQYLRLVHNVRVSVIALIPPSHGIRATLSTVGNSYAVIGGDTFQRVRVQRGPETIAFTSPINATGFFEMDAQSDLLAPFDGMGLEAAWEFRMPRAANPIDYSTIADVLINLEYTALNSYDYEQQVLGNLSREVQLDRAFSLRQDFPDVWYDLHHAEAVELPDHPLTVKFEVQDEDFPPNLDRPLRIKQLALYFVPSKGVSPRPVELDHLSIDTPGMAPSANATADGDGVISTRRGWKAPTGTPVGNWELKLVDDTAKVTRGYFQNEDIDDILFVISYAGNVAAWPAS
ncbi:MAG TPA: neuraminidase-like domain-containing protein [Candidatus Polarisedimenticolia bacterium]|nr:neuraminidase-like domain-containing protein [Candidatus Polarisedimenticolia bacterium]